MSAVELVFIAVGLSVDAFAVAVCKGLGLKRFDLKLSVTIAVFLGGFQALMPCLGYFLGFEFQKYIVAFDHWIAFAMLGFIGFKMIRDSLCDNQNEVSVGTELDYCELSVLAVATSIDAFAVGITLAFLKLDLLLSCLTIGTTTFLFSIAGVFIGMRFGSRFETKAQILGGVFLVIMGLKILFEHQGLLG